MEAKKWLFTNARFWCANPNGCSEKFFESDPNLIQSWLGRPEPLAPCSQADEKRLYAEAFKSPFNVPLFKTLAAQIKDQELAERVIDGLEYGHCVKVFSTGVGHHFFRFHEAD